jgi:hypothetical protein
MLLTSLILVQFAYEFELHMVAMGSTVVLALTFIFRDNISHFLLNQILISSKQTHELATTNGRKVLVENILIENYLTL